MKNVSDKLKVDLENRCSDLLADLRKYKRNEDPHDMKYESERETPLDWWLTFDEDDSSNLVDIAVIFNHSFPSRMRKNFPLLDGSLEITGIDLVQSII
ncbi:unnamed protein product [Rhizophagus irregularis]|nr:unnamed protein product [Rhizophagus irregularis]